MPRPPSAGPKLTKYLQVRLTLDEYTRVQYAYSLSGAPTLTDWLRGRLVDQADRQIKRSRRKVELSAAPPE
jgi:hypothetical protein